ncbi:hypothetical protein BN10_130060 [Phycicoccus elongatus Lp2]|uniref:Uncharacterized protein n=1 Tax=Phycicoccus elongatus Lp2 TaxID=1193181 RepID=N0DZZ5_9MICO|nr:hypothetical protein BN10_130060 [Phycicoccus elongatus Lp2]
MGCQPVGSPAAIEMGQPLWVATSAARAGMSTGGPDRELTRGTMKMITAMKPRITISERTRLEADPIEYRLRGAVGGVDSVVCGVLTPPSSPTMALVTQSAPDHPPLESGVPAVQPRRRNRWTRVCSWSVRCSSTWSGPRTDR